MQNSIKIIKLKGLIPHKNIPSHSRVIQYRVLDLIFNVNSTGLQIVY
jgi:hypothetical protein